MRGTYIGRRVEFVRTGWRAEGLLVRNKADGKTRVQVTPSGATTASTAAAAAA